MNLPQNSQLRETAVSSCAYNGVALPQPLTGNTALFVVYDKVPFDV